MEIKVLGSGCSRCKKALEVVNKVVSESGIDANSGNRTLSRDGMRFRTGSAFHPASTCCFCSPACCSLSSAR